jgi:UDP-galactopyranose mutase
LCLSHLRWGFVYQRPNHLMARCAREHRVFFVEEPIFDANVPWMEFTRVEPKLYVAVPHLRPRSSPQETVSLLRALLDGLVGQAHVRDPILWMYTPMALTYARHLRRSLTVYDCMDELSGFRGAPPTLRERERELFQVADLVFTGGNSLYEAKRAHHRHVHAFPSSVDAAHFSRARAAAAIPDAEPTDQRHIPHPRLGFFGVIDERMDLALVRDVAALRPDLHIVLIGPTAKIDPAQLPRRANIHYLGPKSYDELPRYLAGWDVAIMPFALDESTRYISPTKTLEYLAAGKPVVSTAVHDVVRPYGEKGLVRIGSDAISFVNAATTALAEVGTPALDAHRDACDAFVAQTSWDQTWDRMHALIWDALGRKGQSVGAPCSTT